MSTITALLAIFRLFGYFTEPQLSAAEIHAVTGEPYAVTRPDAGGHATTLVTWNIERGVKFDQIAATLQALNPDIVLLQEVDRSCSRSGNRDVARDLARHLDMNWVAAGEFQEVGEGRRQVPCVTGQAILSRFPIDEAGVVRFAAQATGKWRFNPVQPRRGARVALRARTGGVLAYSVHLESGGSDSLRTRQVNELAADAAVAAGSPVVIGGDFNNQGDSGSAMFSGLTTSGSVVATPAADDHVVVARRPIDWIFVRGFSATAATVRADGASDHDPVVARIESKDQW